MLSAAMELMTAAKRNRDEESFYGAFMLAVRHMHYQTVATPSLYLQTATAIVHRVPIAFLHYLIND